MTFAALKGCEATGSFLELVNSNATVADAEEHLLSELANAAKHTAGSERIVKVQELIRPLYDAVPKDANGKVSHSVVIYTLHRYFAKHRGWTIRGLEPTGTPQNSSTNEMQGWVPEYLQGFLESVVGSSSLSLREVAVFAATLEDFVQKEERQWLERVYEILWLREASLSKAQLTEVLETYLMIYNLDGPFTATSPSLIRKILPIFAKQVKVWNNTQAFLAKVVEDTWSPARTMDFEAVLRTVRDIFEHYSIVYDNDCKNMKNDLLRIESKKPGRVRLTDFYKVSLNGGIWEFNEKIDYLRAFGALDESDPSTPLVVIPNYIGGRQNCLPASSYYALCCRHECEDLMDTVERQIKSPMADPKELIKIVQALSSSSNPAPRTLSKSLVERLERVAAVNDGQVPLHGRLFAQWMHHVFPRECAYPHEAGTTTALTPSEWMKETGHQDATASTEEMLAHVRKDSCRLTPVGMDCGKHRTLLSQAKAPADESEEADQDLPWNDKEELLVIRVSSAPSETRTPSYVRDAFVFLILASMVSALSWSFRSLWCKSACYMPKKPERRVV